MCLGPVRSFFFFLSLSLLLPLVPGFRGANKGLPATFASLCPSLPGCQFSMTFCRRQLSVLGVIHVMGFSQLRTASHTLLQPTMALFPLSFQSLVNVVASFVFSFGTWRKLQKERSFFSPTLTETDNCVFFSKDKKGRHTRFSDRFHYELYLFYSLTLATAGHLFH